MKEQNTLTFKQYRYGIYEPSCYAATLRAFTGDIGGGGEALVVVKDDRRESDNTNREEIL